MADPTEITWNFLNNQVVLQHIISFLPPLERLNLLATNLRLREASLAFLKVQKIVDVQETVRSLYNFTKRSTSDHYIVDIDDFISRPTREGQKKNLVRSLEWIKNHCPGAVGLKNLKAFDPRGEVITLEYGVIHDALTPFKHLQCLEMRNFSADMAGASLALSELLYNVGPSLRELRIEINSYVRIILPRSVQQRLENLRILKLVVIFEIIRDSPWNLEIPNPKKLLELHLRGLPVKERSGNGRQIIFLDVCPFVSTCKNLVALTTDDLCGLSVLPVAPYLGVIVDLKHLRKLEVCFGAESPKCLTELLSCLDKVQELKMIFPQTLHASDTIKKALEVSLACCKELLSLEICCTLESMYFVGQNWRIPCSSATKLKRLFVMVTRITYESLPKVIRSLGILMPSVSYGNLENFPNLHHLEVSNSWLLTHNFELEFNYPKSIRYVTLYRDYGDGYNNAEDNCYQNQFSQMIQAVGPGLLGLKISHGVICAKSQIANIKCLGECCPKLKYLSIFLELDEDETGVSFFKNIDFTAAELQRVIDQLGTTLKLIILSEVLERFLQIPRHITVRSADVNWPPV